MNSFLRCFTYSLVALLLLGAALNFTLDPLGYFRNHEMHIGDFLEGRVWGDERTAYDLSIDTYRPDLLIVGNSRVRHGFAVDDAQLLQQLGTMVNLGLPGGDVDEVDHYVRKVLENKPAIKLMAGLDLEQFLRVQDAAPSPELHGQSVTGSALPVGIQNAVSALWSGNAFRASAQLLFTPHNATLNGGSNAEIMLRRINSSGHRSLARRTEARAARHYSVVDHEVFRERMATLDALLADICLKGTTARLFISPVHIRQLLLIREVGQLNLFFSWKTQLAGMVSQHQQSGCRVTLTDFSIISRYNSEPFPELGDRRHRMQWYWESSHYNYSLGQKIIDRLWQDGAGYNEFGVDLTPANIDRLRHQEQDKISALARSQPGLVQEIRDLIR